MYSIVLTDGKVININAESVEWCEKSRTIRLFNERHVVARINMDNVVGWIEEDYLEWFLKNNCEPQESKDQNNDLCELCLRDPSKCRNLMSPCDYLPKYKVCPICKTNILPYDPICYRCGYDFRAEREDK